jgi:hypothetical protein
MKRIFLYRFRKWMCIWIDRVQGAETIGQRWSWPFYLCGWGQGLMVGDRDSFFLLEKSVVVSKSL